jgi:hypothetical protein
MREQSCCALIAALLVIACGEPPSVVFTARPEPEDACPAEPSLSAGPIDYPTGLHVVGEQIEDAQGNTLTLRGVNRSGTEYRCIQGYGFSDGPSDEASVQAMASWNVNAVRVPLNEACWLGIQDASPEYSGCNYKSAIRSYVALLHEYKLVPILDLHWAAPRGHRPTRLQPLPNADHSAAFWTDVAKTFKDDTGVVFEPYNEPFPGMNTDTPWAWACWRDGCEEDLVVPGGEPQAIYRAAGMQALVTAIREAGAPHLILLGGIKYSNAMSQWLAYKPHDPLSNIGAAWHAYNYNACIDVACWDDAVKSVASQVPLVATEIGTNDCTGTFISPLLEWLDQHADGYLAWSWNAYGPCRPAGSATRGSPYSLITKDWLGTPNSEYAQTFYDHLHLAVTEQ